MREAWWCDSGSLGFCLRFVFSQSGEIFTEIRLEIDYLPISGNIFTHQATEARYTDEVNMFHGKGGGVCRAW